MSIIEKAVSKLDQMPRPSESPARNDASIARALGREPASAAEPMKTAVSRHCDINLAKLREAGMITPEDVKSQIAEEFRIIKRPLIMNAFQGSAAATRNRNLIMVTSSFPGEGKSFCSINLAISIAMEMDHRVLLVDADVAKPSLPGFLGLDADRGLLDVLLDSSLSLPEVMIKTNVEKLTVLPAGRGHRHATELLASEAMNRLLQDMASRYRDRIIIFDSPPLLATTESRVLAGRVGQILMVVESEKTTQEALRDALQQIQSCELISLLLNKSKAYSGADYYGYGGYGN
ncbi:MAG: XrtA-associated tyrosine autokinase [Burkholderiales bacterium]